MSRAAYHEAGHALAALAVGRSVTSVSLDQAGGGRTELDRVADRYPT